MLNIIITTIISSVALGVTGCLLIIRFGQHLGMSDIPNLRSSHKKIVSKGAGIGILATAVFAGYYLKIPLYIWGPCLFISLISLFGGDMQKLTSKHRLVAHFLSGIVFLVSFATDVHMTGDNLILLLPLSVFIVGTSNVYNFMDGIDGMAGVTGAIAFSLIAVFRMLGHLNPTGTLFCAAMAMSCLAFLTFNLPRAKVFMGDVGSILLGFIFSCLVIFSSKAPGDFLVMTGFLLPFYFDEIFTMGLRIKDGDTLTLPHRKHIYQLMANELGLPHWKISIGYGITQLVTGALLISSKNKGLPTITLLFFLLVAMMAAAAFRIHKKIEP